MTHLSLITILLQDECSIVSLRDVVRAMTVFDWFLEKLARVDVLKAKLRQKEEEHKKHLGEFQVHVGYCSSIKVWRYISLKIETAF